MEKLFIHSKVFSIILCLAIFSVGSALSAQEIIFTENCQDTSAGDLPSYKIETPAATYYLEKTGFGLSSLIDKDGNDWISFSPEKGSKAGGEYRGIPNAVFKQDGSFFHPLNSGTDSSSSAVSHRCEKKISITGVSGNGTWECRWDFYLTHCTFTMTKMPADYAFWVLYEGTPGGLYDDTDWWMTSEITEKMPMETKHEKDIPAPEWIAFGDKKIERSLFLFHHEDDEHMDRFYQMRKKMTVFGFGRNGIESYMDSVPQSFSIGLVETVDHAEIGKVVESLGVK